MTAAHVISSLLWTRIAGLQGLNRALDSLTTYIGSEAILQSLKDQYLFSRTALTTVYPPATLRTSHIQVLTGFTNPTAFYNYSFKLNSLVPASS